MTHTFFKVCSKTKCSDHHHHLPSFHPSPGVPFLTSAQQASHDFPAFPTPSILHYHQLQGHQTFPPPPPPPSLSVSAKSRSYTCTYSCKRCYILTTMVGVRVCVWVILWVAAAKHGDGVTVSAPAPSLDCSSAFLELTDCLTFVENGSTVAKPAGKCCSGLKKVVKKEVSCLCDVFKQGASLGVNITKALTLPSACGVSTPPFSKCNTDIAGVPAAAPVPSPSPGAPSSVSTGAPSPLPGKSSAVSLFPGPCFRLLGSMGVTLWLHHQFQGL